MPTKLTVFLWLSIIMQAFCNTTHETVKKKRNELFEKELEMMLGRDIVLNENETKVNEIFMKLKTKELDQGFRHRRPFVLSKHFFEYKDDVKKTELYKLITKMPKGAVLHAHDTSLLGPDYVLELTYWKDLYICFIDDEVLFRFAKTLPTTPCATKWQLVKEARYSSGNVDEFDDHLRKEFTLVVDDYVKKYPDNNAIWKSFKKYFKTILSIVSYKPAWEQYFYDALKEYRHDNVFFLEVRSILPTLYDLDGNVYDPVATAESYQKVTEQFMHDYPDFMGAKLIYAPSRGTEQFTFDEYLRFAKEIKRKLPDFFAGFDLVNHEDAGPPNKHFLPQLVNEKDNLNYYFHAAETNWNGMDSDENLYDALALDTKRIGHGFALIKHPLLIDEVRKRDIAIEVNVISNNVLCLVSDIRNHPLSSYLAQGLPVVVSSDDRGAWEADPLSHDFYAAFVGVASRHADLRLLKKLALNSIRYSTYSDKNKMIAEFESRWSQFINAVKDKHV